MEKRKAEIKLIFLSLSVLGLMIIPSTGYSHTINPRVSDEFLIYEKAVGISGEKAIKDNMNLRKIETDGSKLSTETQITSSEFDESHPAFDIDYNGNPFLLYQSYEDLSSSKIYIQRSSDGGSTWPEELMAYWELEDLTPIKPDVDFTDGGRAFGTNEFEGQEPLLYFHDYVDIDDPETYALYYFDRSQYSTYISETDIAANKSGRVALATILDYEGDEYYQDTLLISWDANNFDDQAADGGVYWKNKDNAGNDIPRSHLCGDAGDKIFFCYESKELGKNNKIYSAYCQIDENTVYSDWKTQIVAGGLTYNCTYPDISVSENRAYCTYMCDVNGNQDIYVAVTTSGNSWNRYKVADTSDNEMYPVISANGEKATCLFMKNGNLYKTSTEDIGVTWSTSEQINTVPNTVVEEYQNIDIEGSYGIWTDNRNGNNDLYFDIVGLAPLLTIDEIKGGLGVKVSLSNIGNGPAENVFWSIDITGGILLAGSHTEGRLSLPVGSSETVKSGFIIGLGRVLIIATFGDTTKTVNGFVLGPFIIGVK